MVKLIYLTIVFCLIINYNICARILAVFPTPSISHQLVFRPFMNELARRGHEVTVITPNPEYTEHRAPNNLTEIDVHDISYKIWREEFAKAPNEKTVDIVSQVKTTFNILLKLVLAQLETKEVQDVLRNSEFDLLFLEGFVRPALIYSHLFKVPVIQISSFNGLSYNYRTVGAVEHPLLYPSIVQQRYYNLTKWEKIKVLSTYWQIEKTFDEANENDDVTLKTIYGSDFPSIHELSNNVQMLFLNAHPIWSNNQPVPPNIVYVRGIDIKPPKPLPEDIQSLLDTSINGVIYFSLGTSIDESLIPMKRIQILIKVFSQLQYDVIWKWNDNVLPGKSKNIHLFKWLPQADLLKHRNVKLFICQAGLHSTDEAIRAGVPLIGIPVQVDQWYNAEKYVHHKIGIHLEMSELNENALKDAISNVIGNPSYRQNILKLRTVMEDQPDSPMDRAVWWTEHVLRHKGAEHLRAAAANLSRAQYYELELICTVIFFILFGSILCIVSIYKTVKYVKVYFTNKIKVS